MQITHEQAHHLIQLNLDAALNPEQTATLSAHLRHCADCQEYAKELKEVESLISPILKRQWTGKPIPLSIPALTGSHEKAAPSTLLTMRTAAMGLMVLAFFFSLWQFVGSVPIAVSPVPLAAPLVPTPSSQTAQLTSTTHTCEMLSYSVQGNETLAEIAARFSVPAEEIIAANNLQTHALKPSMELRIPSCKSTPTGTVHPATLTTTYTPFRVPITSTPGGS